MRRSFLAAAWFLAAGVALAAGIAAPAGLTYRSVSATRDGRRIHASFESPDDPDAHDLRGDPVTIRIGSDEPVVFGGDGPALRVAKNGRVARFRAKRSDPLRVRRFRLCPARGEFVVSLGGGRLDADAPPRIELSFAGRIYRW